MVEEFAIAFAEVVQAFLPVRCHQKSVLRAFSVAGESDFAGSAVLRQCRGLCLTKLTLRRELHESLQITLVEIPQKVRGSDEMVATVDVTIVFHNK